MDKFFPNHIEISTVHVPEKVLVSCLTRHSESL